MSCRRGDSDFTLQEGGNGTVTVTMPTYGARGLVVETVVSKNILVSPST